MGKRRGGDSIKIKTNKTKETLDKKTLVRREVALKICS